MTTILHPDLDIDLDRGVACQRDRTRPFDYDEAYFAKYVGYSQTGLGRRLTDLRLELVQRYSGAGMRLHDVGIGSGQFLLAAKRANYLVTGSDVSPAGIAWLDERGWRALPSCFHEPRVVTFWDSLEHLAEPGDMLDALPAGSIVCLSLPIFSDLTRLAESKHYKPDEHLWYFTRAGLIRFFAERGFDLLEVNDAETQAGRESILSFAFRKATVVRRESLDTHGIYQHRTALLTGALGDILDVAGWLSPGERAEIRTILWASPQHGPQAEALVNELLPAVREHRVIWPWTDRRLCFMNCDEVAAELNKVGQELPPCADWSIERIFAEADVQRAYSPHPLAGQRENWSNWWAVQAFSSHHPGEWRDFAEQEWQILIDFLQRTRTSAVIFGTGDQLVPDHPRIVNCINKHSLVQAIRWARICRGLIAVDSMFSVVAAQSFSADRIAIRARGAWPWRMLRNRYAPHWEFPFFGQDLESLLRRLETLA